MHRHALIFPDPGGGLLEPGRPVLLDIDHDLPDIGARIQLPQRVRRHHIVQRELRRPAVPAGRDNAPVLDGRHDRESPAADLHFRACRRRGYALIRCSSHGQHIVSCGKCFRIKSSVQNTVKQHVVHHQPLGADENAPVVSRLLQGVKAFHPAGLAGHGLPPCYVSIVCVNFVVEIHHRPAQRLVRRKIHFPGEKFPVLFHLRAGADLIRHLPRDVPCLFIVSLVIPVAGGVDKGVVADVLIVADVADIGTAKQKGGNQQGTHSCPEAAFSCGQRSAGHAPGCDPLPFPLFLPAVFPVQKGLDPGRHPAVHPAGGEKAACPGSHHRSQHRRHGRPYVKHARLQPYTCVSFYNARRQIIENGKSRQQSRRHRGDTQKQPVKTGEKSRLSGRHAKRFHGG